MNKRLKALIDKLAAENRLESCEYSELLSKIDDKGAAYLASLALKEREKHYGRDIYIRGLIEISNICKNDCYYCGIRASNNKCERYRLSDEEILGCCEEGYSLGFKTFVLQGGEDAAFSDERLCGLLAAIKNSHPDCAVTLSLGERNYESYKRLRLAGADRYLLRHETSNAEHYSMLHPPALSWDNRMECLNSLKSLGFQVGCGFMVGSPYQTLQMLAEELCFIGKFKPDMCGIGPFIPHKATKFAKFSPGSAELTCILLSCIRLIHPTILLPATTALGTLKEGGREQGILSGANVVMPNLSPKSTRKKYMLYNNKLSDGDESAQAIAALKKRMESIGFNIVTSRGDVKRINN